MAPDAGAQTAEGLPPNPVVALGGLRLGRVTCSAGHPLAGLFVIFRKHEETWLKKLKEAVGPLDPPFQVGVVGQTGYLAPPGLPPDDSKAISLSAPSVSPVWADLVPDTHRLAPNQPYQAYLVHHPSLELALDMAKRINAGEEKTEPQLLRTDAQSVLQVPEDPKSFFPQGPKFYDGWWLFRAMPAAACPPCVKQVRRLQAHLGALRYPVGSSNFPYLPDFGRDSDKSGGDNDGQFDVRVMNAVASFQQDLIGGQEPFQVVGENPHAALVTGYEPLAPGDLANRNGAHASPETSWKYLQGHPVAAPAGQRPPAASGLVDAPTADAIKAWLDGKLRKPGAFLVQISDPRGWHELWLRPEAARSWLLWNELTKALGFPEGIAVNHTFRSALVDIGHAGYGRSARSIHKTGLAMDLGIGDGFKHAVADWPITFSRELDGNSVWFRLFAAANQPLPAADADAAALEALAAPLRAKLTELATALRAHAIFSAEPALVDATIGKLLERLQDPGAFFAKFYRTSVDVWEYDPFHPEGGAPVANTTAPAFYQEHVGPARKAALEKAMKAVENARSAGAKAEAEKKVKNAEKRLEETRSGFLDLTLLAEEVVGLSRIHSFKAGWQEVVRTTKAAALPAIAVMLKAAKTSPKRSAANDAVVVRRKADKLEMKVSDLDHEFMLAWGLGAAGLKKSAKSVSVNLPQVTVLLSWGPKSKIVTDSQAAATHLRTFGDKKFFAVDPFTGEGGVKTGNDWATLIDGAPAKLEELALVKKSEKEQKSSKAPAPEKRMLTLQPIFKSAWEPPAEGDVLAQIPFQPGDVADVPAPGQPVGMEWWHYQRSDLLGSGKSRRMWGQLLMALGWTREGLLDGAAPVLFGRRGVGYPVAELEKGAF